MAATLPVHARRAEACDFGFCIDAWLRSYKSASGAMNASAFYYFELHRPVVEKLLSESDTFVIAWDDDPSQIFGFICAQTLNDAYLVHYVYVKSAYRHFGFAKTLCKEVSRDFFSKDKIIIATSVTRASLALSQNHKFVHIPALCSYAAHESLKHPNVARCLDHARRHKSRPKNLREFSDEGGEPGARREARICSDDNGRQVEVFYTRRNSRDGDCN